MFLDHYLFIINTFCKFIHIYHYSLKSSLTFLDNFKSNVDTQSNMFARVSLDSYKKITVIANAVKKPQVV